ncbi:MAG TPA: glycerophosphoryl diester phosphodiesterase membrane domain-containing protein [Bacteroidota bacterium]
MASVIVPMTLGDMFDRWFKLIGRTWLRNLILAAIILGPASLVFAIAFDIGFSEIANLADLDQSSEFDPESILWIFEFLGWFILGMLLFIIGTIAATVAITIVGAAEMSEQPQTWQEALRTTFGIRLVKVFGQYFLEIIALGIVLAIPYGILLAGIIAESVALGLVGGLLFFVAIPLVIYAAVSFAFTIPIISWENEDIFAAFRRSWELVRGNWWRTFGILILMSLIVSFAVSIIMTPLYIIILWDFFKGYFEAMSAIGAGGEPDPELFKEMFTSFGFGFGMINALTSVVQIIVAPLYVVVLYFDLRARHREFNPAAPSTALPGA